MAVDVHQHVVGEVIALQLAIDCRGVASDPLGDARDGNTGVTEAGEQATFVEGEMGEQACHARSPKAVFSQK